MLLALPHPAVVLLDHDDDRAAGADLAEGGVIAGETVDETRRSLTETGGEFAGLDAHMHGNAVGDSRSAADSLQDRFFSLRCRSSGREVSFSVISLTRWSA